jgi:predicted acyltransferase
MSGGERIRSIDVLRGLVVLVMIFVNDVAGVRETPAWMKHIEPPGADGMTFVDVVFPAFLFLVGMSIPAALERRLGREPLLKVLGHIVGRTLGLLVLGVFMVNSGGAQKGGVLSKDVWVLLMYAGAILVWAPPPPGVAIGQKVRTGIRGAGVALLAALAVLYRGAGEPAFIELRHSWWGILGLIGWAYLVASMAYLLVRRHVAGLVGGVALLYCVYVANAAGYFAPLTWITDRVDIGSMLGSHAALTLSGAVLGVVLLPDSPVRTEGARLRWTVLYGAALAAAGHLLHAASDLHPAFIINKIAATPPWCLWSAAITVWSWAALHWLLAAGGAARWAGVLERAGQNALFAYIAAPIFYSALALSTRALAIPNLYWQFGGSFATGFLRSLALALLVTWLAAAMRRRGVVLRL